MKNVGSIDKKFRLLSGIVLLALSFLLLGGFNTMLGAVGIIVGIVLIATGVFNFCPAYKLLGIGTINKNKTSA